MRPNGIVKPWSLTLLVLAMVLGLAAALGACGAGAPTTTLAPTTTTLPGTGDWPAYHHDMARSGISDYQQPLGQVTQAWSLLTWAATSTHSRWW